MGTMSPLHASGGQYPAHLARQVAVCSLREKAMKDLLIGKPVRLLLSPAYLGKLLLYRQARKAQFHPAYRVDVIVSSRLSTPADRRGVGRLCGLGCRLFHCLGLLLRFSLFGTLGVLPH